MENIDIDKMREMHYFNVNTEEDLIKAKLNEDFSSFSFRNNNPEISSEKLKLDYLIYKENLKSIKEDNLKLDLCKECVYEVVKKCNGCFKFKDWEKEFDEKFQIHSQNVTEQYQRQIYLSAIKQFIRNLLK